VCSSQPLLPQRKQKPPRRAVSRPAPKHRGNLRLLYPPRLPHVNHKHTNKCSCGQGSLVRSSRHQLPVVSRHTAVALFGETPRELIESGYQCRRRSGGRSQRRRRRHQRGQARARRGLHPSEALDQQCRAPGDPGLRREPHGAGRGQGRVHHDVRGSLRGRATTSGASRSASCSSTANSWRS